MSDRDYTELYASLQKETTILTAQIRALYRELDKKFHLRGAQIPITFGFETDALGSYTRTGHHEKEHFHFSLLFVGYGVKNPLSKEDRMDLYKHEYAHYMEHHNCNPKGISVAAGTSMEVPGNIVVPWSERRRHHTTKLAKR